MSHAVFREFKEFALKGNVLDMAIGVIIGTAFGKIVTSLLADVLMPPIGLVLGNVDFSNLFVALNGQRYLSLAAAKTAGAPTINYGVFLSVVLDFAIVAVVMFLLIKPINRLKQRAASSLVAPTTKDCRFCLSSIPLHATRCAYCTSDLNG